ncbi:unnamed protein product [Closterium sp. NIES-65]|nr:unnamed protein product [Closterium sp. NIES-65]
MAACHVSAFDVLVDSLFGARGSVRLNNGDSCSAATSAEQLASFPLHSSTWCSQAVPGIAHVAPLLHTLSLATSAVSDADALGVAHFLPLLSPSLPLSLSPSLPSSPPPAQMHWRLISPPPPLSPPSPSTAASATHGLACFQRTLIIAYLFPSFSLPLVPSRPLSPSLPLSLSPSLPSSSPPAQTHWRLISPPPPPSPPSPGTAASASHPTPPVLFPSLPPLPPHPTSTDALAPHLASSPALTTISLHRCFGLSPHTVSLLLEASRKPGSVLTALVFSHVDRLSLRHVAPPDTAIPSAAQSEPPKEDEDGRMSFLGLTRKREEEGEWWEMTCKGGCGEWGLAGRSHESFTRPPPAPPLPCACANPLPLVHCTPSLPAPLILSPTPPHQPPSQQHSLERSNALLPCVPSPCTPAKRSQPERCSSL